MTLHSAWEKPTDNKKLVACMLPGGMCYVTWDGTRFISDRGVSSQRYKHCMFWCTEQYYHSDRNHEWIDEISYRYKVLRHVVVPSW